MTTRKQGAPVNVHVEVHVNGYAVELDDDVVTIYELGTRRRLGGGYFEGGRIRTELCRHLDNEHGANWQNYLAIEEHLRFAVEHSGVE